MEKFKRFTLQVPYEDKGLVKDLGAWWYPERKHWYVSIQTPILNKTKFFKKMKPFKKWIPNYAVAMEGFYYQHRALPLLKPLATVNRKPIHSKYTEDHSIHSKV